MAVIMLSGLTACSSVTAQAPRCGSIERVALIAQSVPSSTYVPCIIDLPAGWSSGGLSVRDGSTEFTLRSDRASHPVEVTLHAACDLPAATPIEPRTPGGRSYLELRSIDPDYSGTMFDVFPGGCVSYRFDFTRGAHIALIAELQQSVGFISRPDLQRHLQARLGVRLDP
ncbi:MAG TPA: hypothetical protein VE442_11335 [Jatrophihabitans sp.]|nr:hypothetical protein [Jatrophihabitans sp.]